eukprot:7598381-Lingulodinium_polyedra.AAC.1
MGLERQAIRGHEVHGRCVHGVKAMEPADVQDAAERDTHHALQLRRGQVHAHDALGHWVPYPHTRVQLQEGEAALSGAIKVLHDVGTPVAHER